MCIRDRHEVLGPHALLVVREEVAQPEVVGYPGVLVLRRHLDEAAGRRVAAPGPASALLAGPAPEVIQPDATALLGRARDEGYDAEVGHRLEGGTRADSHLPDAGLS